MICQNICLATSQIKMSAVYKNDQLMEHLFGNNFDSVTANKSVSQLHHIQLLDPLSGSPASLPNTILYSVFIPISDYQPSNYYACLLFIGKTWEDKCITSSYARRIDGVDYMLCSCSGTGLLSVFTTLPPIPADYPDHNEIRMSFDLNTAAAASSTQRATFLARLAAVSTVDERRFVNCSSTVLSRNASQIWVTLRPPFRLSQMTNSYAVQAIQRATETGSGFKAYDSISIVRSTYNVVKRDLNGDGNARKVIITIDRSFQNVVGNDTAVVASKWCESISSMLRVSIYRFKNARVSLGIVFNVTITLPFEDDADKLSAEEISLMLMECSEYQEFDLHSIQGETLPVQPITDNDVVELIVNRQLNPLALSLIIVISTILAFVSLYVGGAVVVKVRTDRLVQEERRKMVRIEPSPAAPPPQYTQTVSPGATLSDRYPSQRFRHVARHQ